MKYFRRAGFALWQHPTHLIKHFISTRNAYNNPTILIIKMDVMALLI